MLNFAEQTGSGAVMIVWSFLPRKGTIKVYEAVRARVPQKHQSDTLTQHTTANLPTQLNNKQTNKQQESNHKATTKQQKEYKKLHRRRCTYIESIHCMQLQSSTHLIKITSAFNQPTNPMMASFEVVVL